MAILVNPEQYNINFKGGGVLSFRPMTTEEQMAYQKEISKCFKIVKGKAQLDADRMVKVKVAYAKLTCVDIQGFEKLVTVNGEKKQVPLKSDSKDDKAAVPNDYWSTAWTEMESQIQLEKPETQVGEEPTEFEEFQDPNA